LRSGDAPVFAKRVGRFLRRTIALVGALKLVALATRWQLPLDQWLFSAQLNDPTEPPSRIALRCAISLVLAGTALLLLDFDSRAVDAQAEYLATIIATSPRWRCSPIATAFSSTTRRRSSWPMSFPGSIAFLSLAGGDPHWLVLIAARWLL
jgi:hypothetical protein